MRHVCIVDNLCLVSIFDLIEVLFSQVIPHNLIPATDTEINRKSKGYFNPYQLDILPPTTNMREPFHEVCVQIVQSLDS
ncbi:hypothetical protein V6Z12_A12G140500 [Gossypium hirsutum]